MHKHLLVFDIETVIDVEAARRLLDIGESISDSDVIIALENYHLKITDGKNKFARQPFHKIAAISFLVAEIVRGENGEEYKVIELRSGGKLDSSEKELVSGFWGYAKTLKPRFVSFNGRTFDIPVLKYRAIVHDVEAKWYYQSGDKWNNYNSRYSVDWHCDLLEAFSDFGASSRVKMNELCAAFGFPGKMGVDGSDVQRLVSEGKLQEVRDYCELDVLNTYLLYLKYAFHTGITSAQGYQDAIENLVVTLEEKEGPHFHDFLSLLS